MSKQNPDVRISEDAEAAVDIVAEETDEELSEQRKNLIIAQAESIGDI